VERGVWVGFSKRELFVLHERYLRAYWEVSAYLLALFSWAVSAVYCVVFASSLLGRIGRIGRISTNLVITHRTFIYPGNIFRREG
jgi:uncharacterized membrane protein